MGLLNLNKEKNKKGFLLAIIGFFLILIGSLVLIYNYYENRKIQEIEENSIEEFFEDDTSNVKELITEKPKEDVKEQMTINYVAILEIPRINLKRGLVDKNSDLNNVNKNIYTLKDTSYPGDSNISHIILAAHSGNSSVSFFKNLKQLDNDDYIYLYYNDVKYIYKVFNHYEIEKTGTMKLNLSDKSDITLITCKSGTNKQFVYKAILINQENY